MEKIVYDNQFQNFIYYEEYTLKHREWRDNNFTYVIRKKLILFITIASVREYYLFCLLVGWVGG